MHHYTLMQQYTKNLTSWVYTHKEICILLTCTTGIWLVIGILLKNFGIQTLWHIWGVPVLSPVFLDLRLIPGTLETLRMGLDPTITNPGDPHGRLFNYPLIWYVFQYTSLNNFHTPWIGILLIILFFWGVLIFPEKIKKNNIFLMLLVLFSPAAMLLYERANIDLFIFFLCALAVRWSTTWVPVSVGILSLASLLKLFPFFGMSMFIFQKKNSFLRLIISASVIFSFYIIFAAKNISSTLKGSDISYGVNVIHSHFFSGQYLSLMSYGIVLSLLYICVLLARRSKRIVGTSARNLNAFWLGASLYTGTFLLGNNWDYRLVGLLFTIPQLQEWVENKHIRYVCILTINCILLSCWYLSYVRFISPPGRDILFSIDEFINWLLFALLFYLLMISAPVRFRSITKK